MSIFPRAPRDCRAIANLRVGIAKQGDIGIDEPVLAQVVRNSARKLLPLARKDAPDVLHDPLHLAARGRRDKPQHHRRHAMGMSLRVGEAERGAPGQAENGPAIDAQPFAQHLDVGDKVSGGVGAEIGVGFARERPAAPRPALVEQHCAIEARIEEATLTRRTARPGTAMQKERGLAGGSPATLPVHLVPTANVEPPACVGFDGRELLRHGRAPRSRVRKQRAMTGGPLGQSRQYWQRFAGRLGVCADTA